MHFDIAIYFKWKRWRRNKKKGLLSHTAEGRATSKVQQKVDMDSKRQEMAVWS